MKRVFLFGILVILMLPVSGCWRFDYQKVPLYDEVFVEEKEEKLNKNKREPQKNPQLNEL